MKVVCDTNILFAAIISPRGTPRQVLDAWQRRRFTLLTSRQQLSEIRRVSRYPTIERHTSRAARGALIRRIELTGVILDIKTIPGLCDDPDDDFLLSIALIGQADYLVTGDSHIASVKKIARCRIVSPAELLERLGMRTP